jgi:tetratricopeptide (TPR) repeat protein
VPRLGLKPFPFLRRHFGKCLVIVFLVAIGGAATGVIGYRSYHLRAASEALRKEEYGKALEHVRTALWVWSSDVPTHLLAAKTARLNGDYIEADRQLKECKRLQGSSSAETQVEWLLLRAESNELDEVAPGLLFAVDQDHPRKLEMLETLARASMHQMRYRQALDYLDKWLGFEPDNARALDWRSWTFEHLNLKDKAVADAERSLGLQPDRYKLRLRLIELLLERKNTRAAVPHAEMLAAARPNDPDALVALARCRLLQGEPEEGQQLLEKSLALNPDDPAALLELALIYNRNGHPADAERLARRGLQRSPDDGYLLFVLCESYRLQGKEDAETEHWTARNNQVRADVELAENFLRTQAESAGRTADVAAAGGCALLRLHQDRLGLHWLNEALKQDPAHRIARLALADYFEKKGNADAAREHREAARGGRGAMGAAAGCSVTATLWGSE